MGCGGCYLVEELCGRAACFCMMLILVLLSLDHLGRELENKYIFCHVFPALIQVVHEQYDLQYEYDEYDADDDHVELLLDTPQ